MIMSPQLDVDVLGRSFERLQLFQASPQQLGQTAVVSDHLTQLMKGRALAQKRPEAFFRCRLITELELGCHDPLEPCGCEAAQEENQPIDDEWLIALVRLGDEFDAYQDAADQREGIVAAIRLIAGAQLGRGGISADHPCILHIGITRREAGGDAALTERA